MSIPTKEGFYWGRWHTACPGTADEGDCCMGTEWEVHHVVTNDFDPDAPDHLMVMVPGVAKWQPLDAFEWGPEVSREAAA